MFLVYLLIGVGIGAIGTYFIIKPKLRKVVEHNTAIDQENKQLEQTHKDLQDKIISDQNTYAAIKAQAEEIKNSLNDLKITQTNAADNFYKQALELAQLRYEQAMEKISEELEAAREEATNTYLNLTREAASEFQSEIFKYQVELDSLSAQVSNERNVVDSLVAQAKRRQEMETKADFYRIVLSTEDIDEIKRLRAVIPFLRDKTPLNKVIYKVYYEKPLTDMIGRVVGQGVHTGIYKITSIQSGMCYVGQAANIADRWRQHAKRGVGAEDWTQNKLYPAMYASGIENFTFEILEECERNELNEKEKYYQTVFHAQDFGYSIK